MKRLQEEMCLTERQKDTEHAEACRVFALERIASCDYGDRRWRTKLEFGSREPFDDSHRSTAFGTVPRVWGIFAVRCMWLGFWLLCRTEQVKAKWQERGAFAVGQKAEMPDAHKALGKDVQ